jgi:hypothetical protein
LVNSEAIAPPSPARPAEPGGSDDSRTFGVVVVAIV